MTNTPAAARTRKAYIVEALLEYMVSILVTGTFLSAILKQVGVSDAVIGIVSSLTSLACCAQVFSGLLVRKGRSVKKTMILTDVINQLMFSSLYFIPFLPIGQKAKTVAFVVMILGAYLILHVSKPEKYKWLNAFVSPSVRGSYSALKEIVSLIGGMAFTYGMSRMVDRFTETGRAQTGFILCGITILVLSVLNLVSLLFTGDVKSQPDAPKAAGLAESLRFLRGSAPLKRLIVVDVLFKAAVFLSTPFYGAYLIGDLGFSLTAVSLFQMVYAGVRVVFSPRMGRIADKHGNAHMLSVCFLIASASFFVNAFTCPKLRYAYLIYNIIYAVSEAGINNGINNITYDYIPLEHFSLVMGTRNAVCGAAGFLVSLAGSAIVAAVQKNGLTLFGKPVYAPQILSFGAAVLFLIAVIYLRTFIIKMPRGK